MADFAALEQEVAQDEEGAVTPIYKKDGSAYVGADGSPSTITVRGSDARCVVAAKNAITRRLLSARRHKMEPEDIQRNRIDTAASAVIDWSGWEAGGKAWPCIPENVKALLGKEHILTQVEAAIDGHASFFTK